MTLPRLHQALCLATICAFSFKLAAAEPLAPRIDQLVETDQFGPLAGLANDGEFLRRVTLDLHGVIPTSAEARAFLDDPSPNKREVAIDRLFASPRFAVHMANVFDVMLMERRPDKNVTTAEWQKYLQTAFEKNTPYDQLAREILGADGVDANLRPAAKFFLDRDAEPHLMTRDVGRVFFGMDLQCAQCHDHPLVDHYLQTDYYGLFAFVNRTSVFADAAAKKSFLSEKADGDASYKSVFTQDAGHIRPQLPGDNEIEEPRLRQGEDYVVAPLPNVRPVPKYSRRAKLAELATNGSNRQFNVNITNRIWAHLMGRGLVHPVDLHHPLNPPSHPAVLELVTNEFVAMKYDIKWVMREIVRTKTYQRSIDPPSGDVTPYLTAAAAQMPTVTAENTSLQATAEASRKQSDAAQTEFKTARAAMAEAEAAWRKAEVAVTTAKKPVDDSAAAIAKSQSDATAKQSAINAVNEAAAKSGDVAKLLPNDKEIAAALATFTAKQKTLADELAAVQKTIADQTAAQQPLQAKLVEAYAPADTAYAAYLEARKPVDQAKQKLVATWNQHRADALAAAIRKKRVDGDQSHVAYQSTLANIEVAKAAIESRKAELSASIQAVEGQRATVSSQVNVVAEVEKVTQDAARLLDEAKTQFTDKQSVVQAVTEAVAKTEAALQKLPGDADLTQTVQKLKDRLEPLTKESSTLEQAVAVRDKAAKEMAEKLAMAKQLLTTASNEMSVREQAVTAKTNEVNLAVTVAQNAETAIVAARGQLVDLWTTGNGVRVLKQISPEQIGWATIRATGVLEGQIAAADAEIEKTLTKAAVANDATQMRARDVRVEQQLNEQMRGHVSPFVNLYGASAGQPQEDFFATPDQALFVANGGTLIGWISGGGLAQRLAALTDSNAFAEEMYLSVLTRRPTEVEINETTQYLASRPNERPQAIRELVWSLLTSAEFRFNH